MRILVIGAGGREHALAWKLASSPRAERVLVAPGNAGTALEPGVENVDVAADDVAGLVELARREAVDLTIVGPEAPLVAGVVDRFAAAGLRCFGPRAAAARLEGSKAFAKDFMAQHGIPAAASESFDALEPALAYLAGRALPIVIKADGLAAGKGVVVAGRRDEAEAAVREMLETGRFGTAGRRVVIEDFLPGEEASFIAMVDGRHVLPLATSQDHKARDDGDRGPNTGGMGAYSPAPVLTAALEQRVLAEVMRPVVDGLAADGIAYVGFLYAGLMIGPDGEPRVLEFNCRFGDPETQPVLMRLRTDLVDLVEAALDGRLADMRVDWDPRAALGVVMAAGGYPDAYRRGDEIHGLPATTPEHQKVFHAGTRLEQGRVVTSGGRVLCATALGESVAEARDAAYALVRDIRWEGAFWRSDIGYRAVNRR